MPRRARARRYSVHNGVARSPEVVEPRQRWQPHPSHPADVAQSALFEAILVEEIDELEDRAATAERRWHRRCERNLDDAAAPPHDLTELRLRIVEVQRLLTALRQRFPSG